MAKKTPQNITTTPSTKGWPSYYIDVENLDAASKLFEDAAGAMMPQPRNQAIAAGQRLLVLYHEKLDEIKKMSDVIAELKSELSVALQDGKSAMEKADSCYQDWRDAEADLRDLKLFCLQSGIGLPAGMTPPEPTEPEVSEKETE